MNTQLFDKYAPVLNSPSAPIVRDPRLLMGSDGDISIYYAPFEYINPAARIVLVGITPGPTQMNSANLAARQKLLDGAESIEAIKAAKETGAFSGEPLRGNLVKELNHWGFQEWLGISNASELFSHARHMVQTTSLLRYPTFVGGNNYGGCPDMTSLRNKLLRNHLLDHFVKEVEYMKDALFLSLGPKVQKVLDFLAKEGVVEDSRLIRGLLHPSGQNTYRIKYLTGDRKGSVPTKTAPASYDLGRANFRMHYLNA